MSHCLLAQTVRATGLAKIFPAAVKPVVQFCLDNEINMIQMPCPEVRCAAGGLERDPRGKAWYDQNGLREISSELATQQAAYAKELTDAGCEVLAVFGVELSPACATTYLNRGPVAYRGQGIFIEELIAEFRRLRLTIPFIGVNDRWLKKLDRQLGELLNGRTVDADGRAGSA